MTAYTKKLAEYAAALQYEDIPQDVIKRAKLLTMQTLGVSLAARASDVGRRAVELGMQAGRGGDEACIWGQREKVTAAAASLANGTLADTLDWEDCSWTGHPSACAVAAGLALAQQRHLSGKEYLLALVTAYEVYERIAMAVQPSLEYDWLNKGWGLTSWSVYAASVAAGKLLKLNRDEMESLIAISGAVTPLTNAQVHVSRTDFYHFQWGINSMNGLTAALLSRIGISPMPDYLDGDDGYWRTLSDQCRWEWFDHKLGERWMIMETLMKHWPTNMWIQQPLDGMDMLIKKHNLKPEQVASVIISPNIQSRYDIHPEGYSQVGAQFSIPFCLAAMLHHPTPSQEWYSESNRHNADLIRLSEKIRPAGDAPYYRLQQCFDMFQRGEYPYFKLTVETTDGRTLVQEVPLPKGHPRNMMSEEEFAGRFLLATEPVMSRDAARKAIDAVLRLDTLPDVEELINALAL